MIDKTGRSGGEDGPAGPGSEGAPPVTETKGLNLEDDLD